MKRNFFMLLFSALFMGACSTEDWEPNPYSPENPSPDNPYFVSTEDIFNGHVNSKQ